MQEFRTDPVIEPNAARNVLDISANLLAQIRHLVDICDLQRQKSIGGVFDEFRSPPVGEQKRGLVEKERPIDLGHHLAGKRINGADHNPIRPLEIANRGALA